MPNRYVCNAKRSGQVGAGALDEALQLTKELRWEVVTDEKLYSSEQTRTSEMFDKPHDLIVVPCKWVLKLKRNGNGTSVNYLARLVICLNADDRDLNCNFAAVIELPAIQLMLTAASGEKEFNQSFIQDLLNEDV